VQVAAYDTRKSADALAARLVARGYDARVFGAAAPFRVRVGRWGTHAEAAAALRAMKAKGMDGWVVDAEAAP